MCGIVGYIGPKPAADFLIEGLRRLEYRGYDSSGVVTSEPKGMLNVTKTAGRIDLLATAAAESSHDGQIGIGHTRWATHGPATDVNAHPHLGGDGALALVHNGVIENYQSLRGALVEQGYQFFSATDSEVVAHLLDSELKAVIESGEFDNSPDPHAPLVAALQGTLSQLRGTYGLAVVFRDWPGVILAARLGSPLVIGVGDDEHFIASDGSPLVGHTDRIVYLSDHEVAVVTADDLRVVSRDAGAVSHQVKRLEIDATQVELGGYPHYMLKEIFEQPESIRAAMRGRLDRDEATAKLGGLNLTPQQLRQVDRLVLTACGTSWHAAMVGEYTLEAFARLPVEVEYASELRYRNPPLSTQTLLMAITQSGETIDTLAAMREVKRKGHPVLSLCNVVGSTIARESDGGLFLHAGPEIGVASTKAFTSQCVVLSLIALHFGRLRHLSYEAGLRIINEMEQLPEKVEQALETNSLCRQIAGKYSGCDNFLYLGRQHNFPAALEGALKLKEISYIHAEGYPAAEMKHGPIALVDEHTPSVFIVPSGGVYEKVIANMEEIRARGGPVIAIVDEDDSRASEIADEVIRVPSAADYLQPIVTAIPLQLLAYHIAVLRGCDVDKPRNLAKSVTVE
ncbi:Glutamine--fructose-6-phosphate aminotransferase [isomerizing] [Pseudobythopirellula maris]|uniref:Glutamine--fructose-6-phosphate aminotransferase [isomerizing] n=1 Tax=Pseudobythopirellula maris TaxID=2527991 RepID=A0A5C5ZSU1_9BACT|nr:glutamine--fructose-6-phosphate transaminase (isomerizing) [Pseudobythopirellula maris]TWT90320.1 Glutamine--fructose-6-phosphate aminotransferase [isomerizing] [Pseudobythopirellula maris]